MRCRFTKLFMTALACLTAWGPAGARTGKLFLDMQQDFRMQVQPRSGPARPGNPCLACLVQAATGVMR